MSVFTSWADKTGGLEILTLPALEDNYIYILISAGAAAVIDPSEAASVLRTLKQRNCTLTHILVTHHHHDHVAGVAELKTAAACHVIGPDDPRIHGVDVAVADGDEVDAGPWSIKVISTPGHSHTHIAFHDPARGLLWTGDALFAGGCGRLFDCPPERMWSSLQKLAALPDTTRFFCGHEYAVDNLRFAAQMEPGNADIQARLASAVASRQEGMPTVPSTIGLEKKTNPFLRLHSAELRSTLGMPKATDLAVFTELRRRKDVFQ
ncbi:MAG: hydroxyacylglutathione hydrolase [bacterium]